jgi:hypothetical protein
MMGRSTTARRPLGIKLITALFFVESVALIAVAFVGYIRPALRSSANAYIAQRIPYLQAFGLVNLGVMLAPVFAIGSIVEGLGVWLLKRWARTFILWDLGNRLCGGAIAVAMLWAIDRGMLSSIVAQRHFLPGIALNVVIFGYFLDPDTKRAFGIRDDEEEDWWTI